MREICKIILDRMEDIENSLYQHTYMFYSKEFAVRQLSNVIVNYSYHIKCALEKEDYMTAAIFKNYISIEKLYFNVLLKENGHDSDLYEKIIQGIQEQTNKAFGL